MFGQSKVIAKTCPCNIQRFFTGVKMEKKIIDKKNIYIFLIFARNIDCGYTLEPPQFLTSTHNLCFRANIRK